MKIWAGLLFDKGYEELIHYILHNQAYVDGFLIVCDNMVSLQAVKQFIEEGTGIEVRYAYLASSIHPDTKLFHFGRSRNVLLGLADAEDYVFMVDSDEVIKTNLSVLEELKTNVNLKHKPVYKVTIVNSHKGIGEGSEIILAETIRIVKAGIVRYKFQVHEAVVCTTIHKAPIDTLDISLLHSGYDIPITELQKKAATRMKALTYELVHTSSHDEISYIVKHIQNTGHFLGSNYYQS